MSMRVEMVDADGNVKGTIAGGDGKIEVAGQVEVGTHEGKIAIPAGVYEVPKRTRTTGKASAIKTLRSEHARQSKVAATHEMRAQEARAEAEQIAAAIAALEGVDHDGQAHVAEGGE